MPRERPAEYPFLDVGGETAQLIADKDWAGTPLGPPDGWPESVRMAVGLMLRSGFPMNVSWGEDLRFFYNDPHIPFLGDKHPWALGEPIAQVWAEIWPVLGPMVEGAVRGESSFVEDLRFMLYRSGFLEENYFTFSTSPIGSGDIPGMFASVTETTSRVVGARRLATLGALGELSVLDVVSEAEACRATVRVLAQDPADLPFVMVYLPNPDGAAARLVAWSGVRPDSALAPTTRVLGMAGDDPVQRALSSGEEILWRGLADRYADGLSPLQGGTDAPADMAVVLPLTVGAEDPFGALVAGVSPHLWLVEDYRTFIRLVGGQLSGMIAGVRAYEQERHRAEELAELDRAKTVFFSNISHEFRTPLTLMMGPVAELRAAAGTNGDLDRERLHTELDVVHRNGLRLGKLVGTLLDFARAQAGRMDAGFEPVDLAVVTRELAGVFRSAMERAGLAYRVDCDDLGEPVYLDRELWEKVVLNLLSNALKYTLTGSVSVTLRRAGGSAVLRVSDTGVGVPPAELPRMFERFHRAGAARTRSAEGTGIGLALAKELVELHGSTISADSALDVGTTLTVTLPFGHTHLPADKLHPASTSVQPEGAEPFLAEAWGWLRDAPDAPSAAEPAAESGVARVLVVDDNADMRDYLARLLSPHYRVQLAADGETALATVLADPPDLVLADVMLPGLDGIELVTALRAAPATASVPVLLLSARAGLKAAVSGLSAGADDYLVKPFASEELLARMGTHLDLARSRIGESRRMRQLAGAVAEINEARDVDEALDRLTHRARELIGAHQAVASLTVDQDWSQAITSVSLSDKYAAWRDYDVPTDGSGIYACVCEDNMIMRLTQAGLEAHPRWRGFGDQAGAHPPMRGWLAAPLTSGDGVNLGLVQLSDRYLGEFTADDEAILAQLAAIASAVLDKAQLLRQQTEVALTLQRAILGPTVLPPPFAARYEPAVGALEVGGDWYDLVELADDRYGVVVGDVVGRGLAAAAVMGQLRSAARALLAEGHAPAEVLTALDTFATLIPDARCCTVFCAIIDPATGEVRYSSAGHPPAIVDDGRGGHWLLSDAQSVPLSVARNVDRPESSTTVPPGGTLLLYTDGLVERRGEPITDGIERVVKALRADEARSPSELADRLATRLVNGEHDDDVAFLLYRQPSTGAPSAPPDAHPADPLATLRSWLLTAGPGDRRPDHSRQTIRAQTLRATPLRITTSVRHQTVTVSVAGAIDLGTAEEFGRALAAADISRRLVVDLTGVTCLGSVGVNVLLRHADRRPQLIVTRGSLVEQVVTITDLATVVDVQVC